MTAADWERLAVALEYPSAGPVELQEAYVRAFDFDPDCALEMGWHLHRDRPERGAFLAALREALAAAGVDEGVNLPDYLPTLLRLVARDPAAGSELAAVIAPAAAQVLERVRTRSDAFVAPL